MWITSARTISRKDGNVDTHRTGNDSLNQFAVAKRKNKRSCRISLSLSLQKALVIQPERLISEKHRHTFRRFGNWDQIASEHQKDPQSDSDCSDHRPRIQHDTGTMKAEAAEERTNMSGEKDEEDEASTSEQPSTSARMDEEVETALNQSSTSSGSACTGVSDKKRKPDTRHPEDTERREHDKPSRAGATKS